MAMSAEMPFRFFFFKQCGQIALLGIGERERHIFARIATADIVEVGGMTNADGQQNDPKTERNDQANEGRFVKVAYTFYKQPCLCDQQADGANVFDHNDAYKYRRHKR